MARNVERHTNRNVNRNTYANNVYVYGNAARKLDVQREYEEQESQRRVLSNEARKNREKAKHMSLGYIVFLLAAFSVSAVVLISYIRLNAEITTLTQQIAQQEKVLNNMRIDNTEAMTRIESAIDLEQIKIVAITQLGMTYPEEGQIVSYEGVNYDYVRKVADGN